MYPRTHFIPFNGTKEEVLQALHHLLPNDGANPYKEPYNLNLEFGPCLRFSEPQYTALIPLLYDDDMDNADTSIAIQDLLNITFGLKHINTKLSVRHTGDSETVGRFLYCPMLADHLLIIFKSLDTSIATGIEESKCDETETEQQNDSFKQVLLRTLKQQDSFQQVVKGTPLSAASPLPPDYVNIMNNQYDPLNQSLEVDKNHSISTNLNPEDPVLEDNDEETLNLDASQHDIDEHYHRQEEL